MDLQWDFLSDYKPQIIHINYSSTFLAKTRCRYCKSAPMYYYYIRKATYFDPKQLQYQFNFSKKFLKRMCVETARINVMKITTIRHQKFSLPYKSYPISTHKTKGFIAKNNVDEYLTCNCGFSCWMFAEKINMNRPESVNRKSRYNYPQKFGF
jgi:hypothetical protein